MKHKSKNKGKGFTETEREAQLSSQVFVLSELLDMTSTIIEELRTDNDCLVDENNDYSELVCSLHRKIKKLKRKIGRQQEAIAILEWQLERSNGGWDFWYHKAQEYKEKINTETEEETDRTRDSEFSDTILRLLSDNGIDTDEARASVLERFEECILAHHISKEEQSEVLPSDNSSEVIEPEMYADPVSNSNSNYTATAFSQNPVYPYKPTN